MEKIIKYFIDNLNSEYENINGKYTFKFKYKKINLLLEINKIDKIKNPKLFIKNFENYKWINDSHIEFNGRACLFLNYKNEISKEETIEMILDFCENLNKRNNGFYHTKGYRHGFAGIVEEYFSIYQLILNKKNVYKVDDFKLIEVARKNEIYFNKSNKEIIDEWNEIKEKWDEKMN